MQANGGAEVVDRTSPRETDSSAATGAGAARARKVQMLAATLVSLGCSEVLSRSILTEGILPATAESDTMQDLAQLDQEKIEKFFEAAAVEMAKRVWEGVVAWKAGTKAAKEAEAGLEGGKFVDGKYGSLALFGTGLEGHVGVPNVNVLEAMEQEHASTEKFTPSNNKGTRPSLPCSIPITRDPLE